MTSLQVRRTPIRTDALVEVVNDEGQLAATAISTYLRLNL